MKLYYKNYNRILTKTLKQKALVLTLHRVGHKDLKLLDPNENMKVSPSFLESFIVDCKSRGFKFISLEQLIYEVEHEMDIVPSIVITLDDGYQDNYSNAFPIFQKHRIPFTIFISTSFMEDSSSPWWFKVEHILVNVDSIRFNGSSYDVSDRSKKNSLFLAIRAHMLNNGDEELSQEMQNQFKLVSIKNPYENKIFMTWDQVRTMNKSQLLTIGNHTHGHVNLSKISSHQIKKQINQARQIIQRETQFIAEYLCYPYGLYNDRVVNSIQDLELSACVATTYGLVSANSVNELSFIPRYNLNDGDKIQSIAVNLTRILVVKKIKKYICHLR